MDDFTAYSLSRGNLPSKTALVPKQAPSLVLSETQAAAIDLYERGMNVLPVKRPGKEAYRLTPFYTSRLHHCGALCHHRGHSDIAPLFHRNNIGIMTGRTSGNLVVFDCDSRQAFEQIQADLLSHHVPHWAYTSHRGGGYLVRIIEGEAANKPKGESRIPDVEIWGNRHMVVVPPSFHEQGTVYTWATVDPSSLPRYETIQPVSIKALAFLGVELAKSHSAKWEEPELYGLPEWAAVLSRKNRALYGRTLKEGERNKALSRIAYDMAGNQIDYAEAERVILDMAERCDYPQKDAQNILRSAYRKHGVTPARPKGKRQESDKPWQRAANFAKSYDWRSAFGRQSLRRQRVYAACIQRAKMEDRDTWRASTREIAELSNMTQIAAWHNLIALRDAGLIERSNPHETTEAARYRFGFARPIDNTVLPPCSSSVSSMGQPKTQAEQDVFGRLGIVAWRAWKYLLLHEVKGPSELARAICLPKSSVDRALKNLSAVNIMLATYSMAEGTYLGEPMDEHGLARLATKLSDGGSRSRARKELHRLERERRVNVLVAGAISKQRGQHDTGSIRPS